MYFCSGPPRIYAASNANERIEDVALAMHPSQCVFARVTSSSVALWSASLSLPGTRRRLLAHCYRNGHGKEEQKSDEHIKESETRQLWAAWVLGDRLAVVEKNSPFVEFYTFDGLNKLLERAETLNHPLTDDESADSEDAIAEPTTDTPDGTKATLPRFQLAARFVTSYPFNQGPSPNDDEDVATAMSAVPGSKYVFIGTASGMICVVEVADVINSQNEHESSASNAYTLTKMWKIDVRKHLNVSEEPPSCYDLTCASIQLPSKLYLVANFEGNKCFILLLSPSQKRIDLLLSLVNTLKKEEEQATRHPQSRCTTTCFDASGSKLALGWSDGGVSVFRLQLTQRNTTDDPTHISAETVHATNMTLTLDPIRELSLVSWGYTPGAIGAVTALAWSWDTQSLAIGYALRGFAVFSLDGCRLMSSLPQHAHERAETSSSDELKLKEMCAFGVLGLLWTKGSFSLLVIPRSEQVSEFVKSDDESDDIRVTSLYDTIQVPLEKGVDGLCLSLSGAPGRCGAWVRSDESFTKPDGDSMGPAEASGAIQGGDLIVGINDEEEMIVNLPFEEIVAKMKQLPVHEAVKLTFWRLKWDKVLPLAIEALTSTEFMTKHGIRLVKDEELSVREFALRMQALEGDYDEKKRPDMASRAQLETWQALRGTLKHVATHKYVKLLFALFPIWNPLHFLSILSEYHWTKLNLDTMERPLLNDLPARRQLVKCRACPSIAFADFTFAKRVGFSSGNASRFALLESKSVRIVAAPSLDDPCAVTSCVTWPVPCEFENSCPLRLVAVSGSGKHMAVAGRRGFCLLNLLTGKWRLFGNVNEEQDMRVYALSWVADDTIVVLFTRFREAHEVFHLQAYPRNHLDENSMLHQLVIPRENANKESTMNKMDDEYALLECDRASKNLFGIVQTELWCFQVEKGGSIRENTLWMEMQWKQRVQLPSRVLQSPLFGTCQRHSIVDFAVLPRFLHLQDDRVRTNQQQANEQEQEQEQEEDGWLASLMNRLVGGQVPDQYTPEEVLPRFVFVDHLGDVIVWDPENRSQRLICTNVSTMARFFVSWQACAAWPAPCRLIYGLYGPDGMKLWLPLLDGVYLTHTKAFEDDPQALKTFLACHDPLRAKTYDIEFGTASATAELYEQVVREYGIILDGFLSSGGSPATNVSSHRNGRILLREGYTNLRGCLMSVDDPSALDMMLRFDSDVKVLGIEQASGLLVGVSQDVYVPSGVSLPCYDVFTRVQPIFHTLLCFLVQNEQLSWARRVLDGVRHEFALASSIQELFLHSMLEACFAKQCTEEKVRTSIELLRYADEKHETAVDMAEYCEIVAHVARKSEPSRLKLLFPCAGDPMELLAMCQQRSELQTAANFLLILEECSTTLGSSLPLRMEMAAKLLTECIDQEEWRLAQHVVRVARGWTHPSSAESGSRGSIEETLASLTWKNLERGEYERVVWCVEELEAKLPHKSPNERQIEDANAIILDRLYQVFIQGNKRKQLRTLLQAVTEAHYDEWIQRIKHVMDQ